MVRPNFDLCFVRIVCKYLLFRIASPVFLDRRVKPLWAEHTATDSIRMRTNVGRRVRNQATLREMTPGPDRGATSDLILVIGAVVIPVLYALLVNLPALNDPPAWDSSTTVSPAALTMVELDFDIWALANLPGTLQGGPSTHSTSIYTIGLALLIAWLGPSSGFYVAHLISILLIGALSGSTYLLARERLSVRASALVAVAASVLPVVIQQSADVYLDLPLAVITTLACWAAVQRRFWLTVGMAFIGVAIKTSAIFLLPLILLARPLGRSTRNHLIHVGLGVAIAILPFVPPFLTTDRFDTQMTFEAQIVLVQSSISMLVLTVDVFLVLLAFALTSYGRSRDGNHDRVSRVTALLLLSFIGTHLATILTSGTIALLPRYYIAILPAVLASLPPLEGSGQTTANRRRIFALAGLAVLVVFSLVNRQGDFYPLPDHSFYVLAERSTRAQTLLELQVEGTRRLVAIGLPVAAGLNEHFRLLYPDMGYVSETPDEVISLVEGWPSEPPESYAMLIERSYANPVKDLADMASEEGYEVQYETLRVDGFESQLAIASRSGQ